MALILLFSILFFFVIYRLFGAFIDRRCAINDANKTPAHTLQDGIDYITMSRPLIRETDLATRWKHGDRAPAKCISCNRCFQPGVEEGGIYCVAEKMGK